MQFSAKSFLGSDYITNNILKLRNNSGLVCVDVFVLRNSKERFVEFLSSRKHPHDELQGIPGNPQKY